MSDKENKTTVGVDAIKEFIDSYAKLSTNNQLVLLGMIKGMVAVNDVQVLNRKGA